MSLARVAASSLLATFALGLSTSTRAAPLHLPFDAQGFTLEAGRGVAQLATGDFDGDGATDLVTGTYESNGANATVRVRFGPLGTQAGPTTAYPLVGHVRRILAPGDLDGDGRDDFLVINESSNYFPASELQFWRCLPDRTLQRAWTVVAGPGPLAVAAGDFDLDGDLDLATAESDHITPRRNDGGGVFTALKPTYVSLVLYDIVSVDLGADGRPDLVGMTFGEARLYQALPDGTGFDPWGLEIAPGVRAATAGDVDADGDDDLVLTPFPGGALQLFRNDPTEFKFLGALPTAHDVGCLTIGDVDGDGAPDLVLGDALNHALVWHRNRGGFSFDAPRSRPAGQAPQDIDWADVNADGWADPLLGCRSVVAVLAYPAGPDILDSLATADAGPQPEVVALGDVDGDGRRDFVVANEGAASLSRFVSGPDGLSWTRNDLAVEAAPVDLAIADLDADGRDDLLSLHAGVLAQVSLRRSDGLGGFAPVDSMATLPNPSFLRIADLDRDGDLDLLALSTASGKGRMFLGDGSGGFAVGPDVTFPGGSRSPLLRDITQDGWPDLVVVQKPSANVAILPGTAALQFGPAIDIPVIGLPQAAAVLDADEDGRLDLVVGFETIPGLALVRSLGEGVFAAPTAVLGGAWLRALFAGDVDGDGHGDVVALAAIAGSPATAGSVLLVRGRGDGTFEPPIGHLTSRGAASLVVGDVTGDQRPDAIVCNRSENTVDVMRNLTSGPVGVAPRPVAAGERLRFVPNPARGEFTVELVAEAGAPIRLEVYSVAGRRMIESRSLRSSADGRVRASLGARSRLPAGVYLVQVTQHGRSTRGRVVVLP